MLTSHLLGLSFVAGLHDLWRSAKESFFMFFETFWALVFGFGLSGAIQSFVSRAQMQRQLGSHRVSSIVRAALYGTASSSCSYAASAMAKALFQKGADFVSSMTFMFASTNLVVELGVVLFVLIGWQFAAAEFVGGIVMIALLGVIGPLFFRGRALAEARQNVMPHESGPPRVTFEDQMRPPSKPFASLQRWSDAARSTMADLWMLRRELIIGYVIAGLLVVFIPTHVWNDVFIHGHGFTARIENAVLGPLVAMVSFVCSIGNVPLAAALWKGGISFGGVVSFIFADLVAMPLLFVYRRLYGTRMAIRMFVCFWVMMAIAGFVTGELFAGVGLTPKTRLISVSNEQFSWNYTSILNLVFLAIFGALFWLSRRSVESDSVSRYATDPVCGMQVERVHAPAKCQLDGTLYFFCSDGCRDRFMFESTHGENTATKIANGNA